MNQIINAVDLGVSSVKFVVCFLFPVLLSCLILANFTNTNNSIENVEDDHNESSPPEFTGKLLSGLRFIVHYWIWYGLVSQIERLARLSGLDLQIRYILVFNPLLTIFNVWLLYCRGCVLIDRGYMSKYLQQKFQLREANFHDFDATFINPILSSTISYYNPFFILILDFWIIFFNQGHRKSIPNRLKKFVYKAPNEITRLEYIASNLCYVDDTDERFHFGLPTTASSPPSTAFEPTKKSRNTPKLKLNTNNLPKTSAQNPDSGISPRDISFLDFPNVDSLLSDLSTRDGLIENLRADVVSSETNEKVKELTDITINNLLNGPRPDDQIPSQTKSSRSDTINEDAIPYERELPSSSDFVFDSDVYSEQDVRLKTPLRLVLKLKPRRQSSNNSSELKYINSADAFKERISSKFKRQRRNLNLHLTSFERNYQSLPTSPHLDSVFAGCVLKQPLAHATTSRSPHPPPYRLNTEALALSPCLSGKFKINEDSFRRNMHRINPNVHRGWNIRSPPTGGTFSTPLSGVSSYSQHTSTETPYPTEEYLF